MKYHITIIDNDYKYTAKLSQSLAPTFDFNSYYNPFEGLKYIESNHTDAVLLELELEGTHGFKICEEIKKSRPDLPILFLTNNHTLECLQKSFEIGGIDYFNKSLSTSEIKTRVYQRIRLYLSPKEEKKITCGDLGIDLIHNIAFHSDQELKLTSKEYELLKLFIEHPNKVLSKKEILECIWPNTHVDQNNIDTHLFNLRKKIKECTSHIICLKGRGFLLKA